MKVMVVDDEQDVELLFRQHFRREIRQQQIDFTFALSGEEALQQLHAMRQPPAVVLILSDINMPGMNGLQLLKAVKHDFPCIKVAMITAYSDQYFEDAMAFGADNYYNKPLDFTQLKSELFRGAVHG
ncbi:MAG TPA: response regulator [bacterium]|nr:response regulator [bacterium]